MISFDTGTHRFDLRAATILLNGSSVLLHRVEGDDFWALPGGRVEPGEAAEDAAVREMKEELKEPVVCERLAFLVENFFSHAGINHHEVGLYFVARQPDSKLVKTNGPFTGSEGHLNLTFSWFERANLEMVDVRPSFLVEALAEQRLPFQHVVHRE